MKSHMRKRIALLLCIVMAVCCVPMMAWADDEGLGADNNQNVAGQEQNTNGQQQSTTSNSKNATKIPVITYHYLCSDAHYKTIGKYKSIIMPVSKFKKQMKYLHDHGWRTISTQEFADWYDGKIKLPKKSVLITFDDGSTTVLRYALPVLKKYNMKGCAFLVGKSTGSKTNLYKNSCIGTDYIKKLKKSYPDFEFQSHTYKMHSKIAGIRPVRLFTKSQMATDLKKMNKKFGFTVLAYPWGTTNSKMIKALKENGNYRIAFTYGKNAYATRKQNRYKIRRIKIYSTQSFSSFTKWFK